MEKKKFDFKLLFKRIAVFVVLFAIFFGIFFGIGSCMVAKADPLEDTSTVVFDVFANEWFEYDGGGSYYLSLPPPFALAYSYQLISFAYNFIDVSDGDDITDLYESYAYGNLGTTYVVASVGFDFWQSFNIYDNMFSQSSLDYYYYSKGRADGYQDGLNSSDSSDYSLGYQVGVQTAQSESYENGYRAGVSSVNVEQIKSEWYTRGRSDEASDSKVGIRYIWAIASVPISTLANMFNFDFLGINIFAIVTSIFSILLVAFVIKKVL